MDESFAIADVDIHTFGGVAGHVNNIYHAVGDAPGLEKVIFIGLTCYPDSKG